MLLRSVMKSRNLLLNDQLCIGNVVWKKYFYKTTINFENDLVTEFKRRNVDEIGTQRPKQVLDYGF